jgi:hypothetical protein
VIDATEAPWPKRSGQEPVFAYAEIVPDLHNPALRLGYGNPEAPTLRFFERDQLLNMLVWRH